MRKDQRRNDELRNISITRNYLKHPHGSVLICWGDTKVICTAYAEDKIPQFLKGSGKGWISAEYSMLPASSGSRIPRRPAGRSTEIQRLIGRSLRSAADLTLLEEKTIWIDCDVIQADGGTRTASVTGAFVALYDAVQKLIAEGMIRENPLKEFAAGVSTGLCGGEILVDMCYEEDSSAEADMNVVMTENGDFIEIQTTGEERPVRPSEINAMLDAASGAIKKIINIQKSVLGL